MAEAPQVQIDTTMGSIVVELYFKHAPKTTKNFEELAKRGYFDGIKFHRVIKDFVIQGASCHYQRGSACGGGMHMHLRGKLEYAGVVTSWPGCCHPCWWRSLWYWTGWGVHIRREI